MLLNLAEKALMNNPVRAALQRYYEARLLTRMGGTTDGGRVLEVGCGRGVGVEIALEVFGAGTVDAFDLNPDMVERARRRLGRFGERVRLWEGDATCIDAADGAYDAVFDFGIIHHVPEWQSALGEIARVLRPGGRFFFEEVTRHALDRPLYRRLFVHPTEDRFTTTEFRVGLEEAGFTVGPVTERFFGDFVLGVARLGG